MSAQAFNRFEWAKAVAQSNLLDRAKVVAWALAVNFCNQETGRTDPGLRELAAATGKTLDTLKRAIRDLIDAGYLTRTEGRGAGNKTLYTFLSPGNVVPLRAPEKRSEAPSEKGVTHAPSPEKKGAQVHGKGGTGAPSYNKDKQSLEQKGAREDPWSNHRFDGNPFTGPRIIPKEERQTLNAWADWLKANGLPRLCELNVTRSQIDRRGKEKIAFALPWRLPPKTDRQAQEARDYFASTIDVQAARIAAQ